MVLARLGGETFAAQFMADVDTTRVNDIQQVNFRDLFEPSVRRIVGFGVLLAFIDGIKTCSDYKSEKINLSEPDALNKNN